MLYSNQLREKFWIVPRLFNDGLDDIAGDTIFLSKIGMRLIADDYSVGDVKPLINL